LAKKAARKVSAEERNKAVVRRYFKLLMTGRPGEARALFTPDARHHNPYLPQGMDALLNSIGQVQRGPDPTMPTDGVFTVDAAIADRNRVAVYTTFVSASNKARGMRQVHIFKFKGAKVAEYWDVTQTAPEGAPNAPNMW
jgi:predicted SnoaL-like aldol condensation-catalyzing enzyme